MGRAVNVQKELMIAMQIGVGACVPVVAWVLLWGAPCRDLLGLRENPESPILLD